MQSSFLSLDEVCLTIGFVFSPGEKPVRSVDRLIETEVLNAQTPGRSDQHASYHHATNR
jgi:hypothetical protein